MPSGLVITRGMLQPWVQGGSERKKIVVGNVSFAVCGDAVCGEADEQAGRVAKVHCCELRGLTTNGGNLKVVDIEFVIGMKAGAVRIEIKEVRSHCKIAPVRAIGVTGTIGGGEHGHGFQPKSLGSGRTLRFILDEEVAAAISDIASSVSSSLISALCLGSIVAVVPHAVIVRGSCATTRDSGRIGSALEALEVASALTVVFAVAFACRASVSATTVHMGVYGLESYVQARSSYAQAQSQPGRAPLK